MSDFRFACLGALATLVFILVVSGVIVALTN